MWRDPTFDVVDACRELCSLEDGESLMGINLHYIFPDAIAIDKRAGYLSVDADDIRQGSLGDCWLLSALSTIAEKDKSKIFEILKYSTDGFSCIELLGHNFFVDHYVPCIVKNGVIKSIIAPQLSYANEYWPIVIEKALIKLFCSPWCPLDIRSFLIQRRLKFGSPLCVPKYIDVNGGFPRWVFAVLYNSRLDPLETWKQSKRWCDILSDKSVLACACTSTEKTDEFSEDGIVFGHAYSILDTDPEKGLIRVRNPWGNFENTKYDDGDDDGTFWVDEGQFRASFPVVSLMYVTRI
tara:strand:- start:764 stop:1648 length:885 start_codon:yes stop_codon:yes gene_type:complete